MATENGNNKQVICLALSAATGGFLAVLSDMVQKEDASAVIQIKSALGNLLGLHTYPALVGVVLIGLSVALCFIFSADSNKKAFYIGASILAILMTAVPYSTPPGFNSSASSASGGGVVPQAPTETRWFEELLIPPQVFAQTAPQSGQNSSVTVHLETADKKPVSSAIFTLIDASNNQMMARSRVEGSDFTFYVSNRAYLLRVQVDGYAAAERSLNPPPRSLTISLTPSSIPLSVQRMFRK